METIWELLHRWLPVLQDSDWGGGLVEDGVDQEPAVARDVILPDILRAARDPGWKQPHGSAMV